MCYKQTCLHNTNGIIICTKQRKLSSISIRVTSKYVPKNKKLNEKETIFDISILPTHPPIQFLIRDMISMTAVLAFSSFNSLVSIIYIRF